MMEKGHRLMPKPTQSSVDYGKELEGLIVNKFQEIGFKYARRSVGSGNKGELGDIAGQDVAVVEAKNRSTKDITLKEDVWLKLINEIPHHSQRFPMYVLGNENKRAWVVTDIDAFFEILKGYLENEKRC